MKIIVFSQFHRSKSITLEIAYNMYSGRFSTSHDAPFDLILWYIAKKFLLCRNRTNLWCRAHMYFLTYFPPWYVVSEIGLSTIRYFSNTHLFSNIFIMTLNYILCPILVQNSENCTYWRYIYISPASTHINEQHHHSTTLQLYHFQIANIGIRRSIRGRPIVVR